jgi:hypothetical protein
MGKPMDARLHTATSPGAVYSTISVHTDDAKKKSMKIRQAIQRNAGTKQGTACGLVLELKHVDRIPYSLST